MAVKTTYDNLEYHLRQYENVYRSTEMMVDWLEDIGGVLERGKRQYICDMACGCGANIAYMAKKELFEKPVSRFFLDLLGAFAVNREKLGVSTIKTALGIKKTNWVLGLFPQGTRETDGNMDNITRGFAGISKTLKCDILPVAITGALKKDRKPFESKITIRIGKPIPYNDDTKEMVKVWSDKIIRLSQGEADV